MGSPVSQAFYPVNWLLNMIFYDTDTQILSYAILPANRIIHLSIYFCGIYFLQKYLKLSSASAFFVSVLSTFCFVLISFISWVTFFDGCCWFPFLILANVKMFKSQGKKSLRYVGVLGMLWAFVALLSLSHALVMEVFFCLILLVVYMCREEHHKRWILPLKFAGAGIIGIFLSMPAFLAIIVFLKNCARYLPDVGWVYKTDSIPFENFALKHVMTIEDVRKLLEVVPTWSWLSMSGLALFLIIPGVVSKKKLCVSLFLCSVIGVVFTFFYSVGLIVPDVVYYIPFLNNNRENFMYMPFFGFFMTILAAEGISCLEKMLEKKLSFEEQIKYPKIILWVLGGILVYNLLPHHNGGTVKNIYITLLMIIIVSVIRYSKKRTGRLKAVIICEFAVCLVWNFGLVYTAFDSWSHTEVDAIQKISMVNETTKKMMAEINNSGKEDFKVMVAGGSCYPENSGALLGFFDAIGYYNPIPKMAAVIHENLSFEQRSRLQNIKYFLATENNGEEFFPWFDAAYPGLKKREGEFYAYASYDAEEPTRVYVYDSQVTLGDAWLVNNYELYFNDEEAVGKISSDENDLAKTAFINGVGLSKRNEKLLENMTGGDVEGSAACVERGLNYVKFEVNVQNTAVLVTADTYYPGWKVVVNGKKSDILQVDYCNRGALIPGGRSEVEFIYCPFSLRIGYVFQAAGVILFLFCILLPDRFINKWISTMEGRLSQNGRLNAKKTGQR